MIFLKSDLLMYLIFGATILFASYVIWERKFYKWIQSHWFVKRSPWNIIGSLLIAAGVILLSIILLDPRSGETRIKGKVKQDRTIILIDTSTSMLAEDVRPNRLEKAILVAKHFVRKAPGHQISLMVFADIVKKLVPFTNDVDLLDARLDSIKSLRNLNAGSSIGLAIEEAVQYFDVKDKSVTGNIIVITDGEDNAETESFKVPDGISLILIGIGTIQGGPIPLKDSMGFHHGNKKHRAITVITKLNEQFFKNAVADTKNSKSFIVKSYDLPSEEILSYLTKQKSNEKDGENIIRPVALEFFAIPGLLAFGVGILLKSFRPFMVLFLVLLGSSISSNAKDIELSPELLNRIEQLRNGELNSREKINLADKLVNSKAHSLAQKIYKENLKNKPIAGNEESYFNWATSELETGDFSQALSHYDQLEKNINKGDDSKKLVEKIHENIRRAIISSQQENKDKNKEKDKNKDKDKDKKENKGNGGDSSEEQNSGKKEENNKEDKNPFDPKNKDKEENKADEKSEDKEEPGESAKDKEEKNDSGSENEKKDKKRPKVSPLLEQLKQDDRKLQNKLLDVSTQKRKQGRKKDW